LQREVKNEPFGEGRGKKTFLKQPLTSRKSRARNRKPGRGERKKKQGKQECSKKITSPSEEDAFDGG